MANDRTQDKDTSIKDKEQPLDIGAGETDEFIDELQTMDTGNVQMDEDELRQGRADSDKAPGQEPPRSGN